MTRTTTKLRLTLADLWRIHERQIRDGAFGAAMIVALLLIHALLRPAEPAPLAPVVMREAQRPVILIQTSTALPMPTPAPTQTPWPTAEPVVIEVPGPTLEPQVIYVQSPPEVVYVAPTPEVVYQTASEPAAPAAAPTAEPGWAEEFKEPNRAATCAFIGCVR